MNNPIITTGTSLFCVTDHHHVIEVRVDDVTLISSNDDDTIELLTTSIVDDSKHTTCVSNTYTQGCYEDYLRRLYMRNGKPDNKTIFTDVNDALTMCIKHAEEESTQLERQLTALKQKTTDLQQRLQA